MTEQQLYRRLVRRSRHRSRSGTVIVALGVLALVAIYVGIESVLAATGMPALLVSPVDAIDAIENPGTPVLIGAAVAAVLGIVLLIVALTPGTRSRHELLDDRMAIVIDDDVLAGAISNATNREARVPSERIRTDVARRRGVVRITPTSGVPLDAALLTTTAEKLVAALDPRPALAVSVTVSDRGVVGS
jgi:hypothetical protein